MHTRSIDRRALADRHGVTVTEVLPQSPLSVGNGELCFTADLTGLQTFPDLYPVGPRDNSVDGTLLGTQSQWGWHSVPSEHDHRLEDSLVDYDSPRGPVPYVDMGGSISAGTEEGTPERDLWLRANPHRLDLGRIGFVLADGRPMTLDDLGPTHQHLDLWHGEISSAFTVAGRRLTVSTLCDPDQDVVAVRVDGARDVAGIKINFPYGNEAWHNAADWTRPDAHTTTVEQTAEGWLFRRVLDDTRYVVQVSASGATLRQVGPHGFLLDAPESTWDLVVAFRSEPDGAALPTYEAVRDRAHQHWARFWSTGGAVQLAHSDDPRAFEIERRTVLSQYLTAINSAGSMPPQETGLVCNSWRGRFHLEMHWWHSAHFAQWGRPDLLLRSLRWYATALPMARETAQRQGFPGVRWPKQVGPDARESPSSIGPFLVWQQPHPIYLAELVYRARPERAVLEELADVVFATAEFMAGFAHHTERGFELGPPLIPAQESYGGMRHRVRNPAFELVYWHWALQVAQQWRQRLGRPPRSEWDAVSRGMIKPMVRDGVYPAIGVDPYTIRTDHPSMLCALGVLPATTKIDPMIMAATLDDVLQDWDWASTWGWDYPVIAMCATRLGQPERAVQALLMGEEKNVALPNGHNRQSASLPLYLPGNGGLLSAVALMAGGWDGHSVAAPGFPADGSWTVQAEGLIPVP